MYIPEPEALYVVYRSYGAWIMKPGEKSSVVGAATDVPGALAIVHQVQRENGNDGSGHPHMVAVRISSKGKVRP